MIIVLRHKEHYFSKLFTLVPRLKKLCQNFITELTFCLR